MRNFQGIICTFGLTELLPQTKQNFPKLAISQDTLPPPPPPTNPHTYMCVSGQRHIQSSRRKHTDMVAQTMCPN